MFIREKKNKSGSISIQIIKKVKGKSKLVETIGCARNEVEKKILLSKAQQRLKELEPSLFDFAKNNEKKNEEVLNKKVSFLNISNGNIYPIGDELIFGRMFDRLNCKNLFADKEKLELFKSLVISRILYPGSKLYLKDYLFYFKKKKISEDSIYRFLDLLFSDEIKEKIEKCIYEDTLRKLDGKLAVSFYDVTTLHFESESEDEEDLRQIGFSKEGKLNRPQIQLGLFTTTKGYPLSYEVYEGNKFEGHTLKEVLELFQTKFNINYKPIVVADRGMLNKDNLSYLENNNYQYIIGAKIKTLSNKIKEYISNLDFYSDNQTYEIYLDKNNKLLKTPKNAKYRIILSYSIQRQKKDRYLRDKALKRLKSKIDNNPNLTKTDLKSPYKKYLDMNDNCNIQFKINKEKIKLDEKLDGIKGYLTNNFNLSHNEIIEHYTNLYFIEQAFRISKTDLRIRPIYHRLENRIKAHILIAFVAYAIYKEFTIKIKPLNLKYSQKIIRDIIKHILAIKIYNTLYPFQMDSIQQLIYDAVNS